MDIKKRKQVDSTARFALGLFPKDAETFLAQVQKERGRGFYVCVMGRIKLLRDLGADIHNNNEKFSGDTFLD